MRKPTNVYIDGLNLYYGCLRGGPFRWLNLERLSELLLPEGLELHEVWYFTARVAGEDAARRQGVYLQALATLTRVHVVFGQVLRKKKRVELQGTKGAVVMKVPEEKGSDVNLAAHLIHHAHQGKFGAAAVITNDSDQCEAIRIVNEEIGVPVGVFFPVLRPGRKPKAELRALAAFSGEVRAGALEWSQFPVQVKAGEKLLSMPRQWAEKMTMHYGVG